MNRPGLSRFIRTCYTVATDAAAAAAAAVVVVVVVVCKCPTLFICFKLTITNVY